MQKWSLCDSSGLEGNSTRIIFRFTDCFWNPFLRTHFGFILTKYQNTSEKPLLLFLRSVVSVQLFLCSISIELIHLFQMLILFQWWLASYFKIQILPYCSSCVTYTQNKMQRELQNIIVHNTEQWIALNLHFNQRRLHNIKGQITAGGCRTTMRKSNLCTLLWLVRGFVCRGFCRSRAGSARSCSKELMGSQRVTLRAAEWAGTIIDWPGTQNWLFGRKSSTFWEINYFLTED